MLWQFQGFSCHRQLQSSWQVRLRPSRRPSMVRPWAVVSPSWWSRLYNYVELWWNMTYIYIYMMIYDVIWYMDHDMTSAPQYRLQQWFLFLMEISGCCCCWSNETVSKRRPGPISWCRVGCLYSLQLNITFVGCLCCQLVPSGGLSEEPKNEAMASLRKPAGSNIPIRCIDPNPTTLELSNSNCPLQKRVFGWTSRSAWEHLSGFAVFFSGRGAFFVQVASPLVTKISPMQKRKGFRRAAAKVKQFWISRWPCDVFGWSVWKILSMSRFTRKPWWLWCCGLRMLQEMYMRKKMMDRKILWLLGWTAAQNAKALLFSQHQRPPTSFKPKRHPHPWHHNSDVALQSRG